MAVSIYFGLPGCGKTTVLTEIAYKASLPKSPYKHIYGNLDLHGIPGYVQIDAVQDIGKYLLEDACIVIDEATICYDSRSYKDFAKHLSNFFLLHRHFRCDIFLAMQSISACDKRIRSICDRLYWIKKPLLTGWYRSKVLRIPYDIIIPDKDKTNNSQNLGEVIEGYCQPNLLTRLFCHKIKRRRYYPYFDSWEHPPLPELPAERFENQRKANKRAYDHFMEVFNSIPRWRVVKKKKYKKLKKSFEKCLTNI